MKKTRTRIWSILLTFALVLTLLPATALMAKANIETDSGAGSPDAGTPEDSIGSGKPNNDDNVNPSDGDNVGPNDGNNGDQNADETSTFTSVTEYNDAVKGGAYNGQDVYLTITGENFTTGQFNLTNTQERANPPKLHLTLTNCTFTGNTSGDSTNSSFMYLPNCQELVMDGCTFDSGEETLTYGINWNLCGIQGAVVKITNCTFTGSFTENVIKLNQRNGSDDTADDVKPDDDSTPIAASIKSAIISGCTFECNEGKLGTDTYMNVILLGSAGKGENDGPARSTGAFPVTITGNTGDVFVFLAYNASDDDADGALKNPTAAQEKGLIVSVARGKTGYKTADGAFRSVSADTTFLAVVNGNEYTSLQEAMDAVGSGGTITVILAPAAGENLTASSTKTFTVENATGNSISLAINGKTYTIAMGGSQRITYTVPSTPSQSGSSDDDDDDSYSVSVPSSASIRGGGITVSPRSAEKGDTVTITVKPDDGYVLKDLTVTTRGGDEVDLTRKSSTQYTFKMPGSSISVQVSFIPEEQAAEMDFTDVAESFWAYSEIAWAYENGYMNGTSATTFNPGGTVSRQQVWMILARMAGADPADMAAAKAWAVANGISDGTTPGGAVSRQQLVALLYRFASQNGYKASDKADLSGYPDAASVSSYAADAMAWAVANGIIGGTTQGTLNAAGASNRAQLAVILWRFFQTAAD